MSRLDGIQRTNLAGIPRDWAPVVPDDNPPQRGETGNTGSGCIGLYVSVGGSVRLQSRGGTVVTVEILSGRETRGEIVHVYRSGTSARGIHALRV